MNAWDASIDGIYMFNYFNQQSKLWKERGDPEILKKLDKVYFATIRGSGNTIYFPLELIANDKGSNIAQIALRFALSSSKISSVIGIARENELLEGITAASIRALPAEVVKQILEIVGEDVSIDSLKGW